jgi:hypothetical protein
MMPATIDWPALWRKTRLRSTLKVFRLYLKNNGRPLASYVDQASLYRVNPRRKGYGEEMTAVGKARSGKRCGNWGLN